MSPIHSLPWVSFFFFFLRVFSLCVCGAGMFEDVFEVEVKQSLLVWIDAILPMLMLAILMVLAICIWKSRWLAVMDP